jgi:anti-sigma factor RsiW
MVVTNLLSRLRGHRPDVEALSAYADGTVDAAGRARVEAHMAACEACRARLAALQRVRAALAAMPVPEAPRSFRLREADIAAAPRARPAASWRALPLAGAATVVLFSAVLGVDLLTRGSDDGPSAGLTARLETTRNKDAIDGAAAPENAAGADAFDSTAPGPSGVAPPADLAGSPTAAAAAALAPESTAQGATPNSADAGKEQIHQYDETSSATGEDGGVRAGFLIAEIVLGIVAAGAVAAALWSWRRGTA